LNRLIVNTIFKNTYCRIKTMQTDHLSKSDIELWFRTLQDEICAAIETSDGLASFQEDLWERPEGGSGITRIIKNGAVLEKGGVLFSAVHGKTPEKISKALKLDQADFYATGVSIVMHPVNPMVPIVHMNTRYFEMSTGEKWFGGGIDLTPHYVNKEDASYFHAELKKVCDAHDMAFYPKFKSWADDYFFIAHRGETRGIGGIFFDRLAKSNNMSLPMLFKFVQHLGKTFAPLYIHFMEKNKNLPYGENEKRWQTLRRGRYVEFNLVYDKGTKFGLDTNGRTESILMSMPPMATWEYNYIPPDGSKEAETASLLKKNIDWIK
jgi:coproporphyrinogen III oxidase